MSRSTVHPTMIVVVDVERRHSSKREARYGEEHETTIHATATVTPSKQPSVRTLPDENEREAIEGQMVVAEECPDLGSYFDHWSKCLGRAFIVVGIILIRNLSQRKTQGTMRRRWCDRMKCHRFYQAVETWSGLQPGTWFKWSGGLFLCRYTWHRQSPRQQSGRAPMSLRVLAILWIRRSVNRQAERIPPLSLQLMALFTTFQTLSRWCYKPLIRLRITLEGSSWEYSRLSLEAIRIGPNPHPLVRDPPKKCLFSTDCESTILRLPITTKTATYPTPK